MSSSTPTRPYPPVNDPSPAFPKRPRWRGKAPWILAAVGAVWAVFTFFVPASAVRDHLADAFTTDPPPSSRTVDSLVEVARTKVPWISPPTVYSPSIYYLKKHFGRFDPYRLHDEPADQVVATADVPGLYQNSANAEAQRLTVSGNLVGEPRVIEYTGKPVASYLAVLVDSNTPNLALMCRVPADQRTMRLTDGDRVTVTGVLLAEGSSRNANGGPSVFTMYMICSNIAKSTNITMTKRGIAINE